MLNKCADEIWKDIPGYNGTYKVSNRGRVKRITGQGVEKYVSPIAQDSGYAHVQLSKNGKVQQVLLHRLVAEMFCSAGKHPGATQINHKNENKLDNRACNLEYSTPKENTNYGTAIKRRVKSRYGD